jgi:hypothetical protein
MGYFPPSIPKVALAGHFGASIPMLSFGFGGCECFSLQLDLAFQLFEPPLVG